MLPSLFPPLSQPIPQPIRGGVSIMHPSAMLQPSAEFIHSLVRVLALHSHIQSAPLAAALHMKNRCNFLPFSNYSPLPFAIPFSCSLCGFYRISLASEARHLLSQLGIVNFISEFYCTIRLVYKQMSIVCGGQGGECSAGGR